MIPDPIESRDLLLNQGMSHLQQALSAENPERAKERLQSARAVASNLARMEGSEHNRQLLTVYGTRVRNILSNRDMLANAEDADQMVECVYCKTLVYPIPDAEATTNGWNNQRCVEHQDEAQHPEPVEGPGS